MSPSSLIIEEHILEGCLIGELRSQKSLYDKYYKAMYSTARRIVSDSASTEDTLQESFLIVFAKIKQFKREGDLGAWIRKIVVNESLKTLRARPSFIWLEEEAHHLNLEYHSREEEVDLSELKHAMISLPDGARTVISLYLFEGYSHAEIATILNISVSTSKSQYQRAKNMIRKRLEKKKNGHI